MSNNLKLPHKRPGLILARNTSIMISSEWDSLILDLELKEVFCLSWLDRLERRFGRFAIKGLMSYVVGLNAFVYLMAYIAPEGVSKLVLIPELVMKGEVWRLVTFIFIPPETTILWIFFILYFYYLVGSSLEHEWGSFRFNIYYLIGIIGTAASAFITSGGATAVYLNLSLFLAFARLFPDFQLLLFFILPVKVKYLAWVDWAFIAYTVLTGDFPVKMAAVVSVINYFIFFGRDIITRTKSNRQAYYNRRRFNVNLPKDFTIHRCVVCGKTEKDDPKMDFRYCADCEGDYEYCMDHLHTHEHIKKG